jgi:hypothetical protein
LLPRYAAPIEHVAQLYDLGGNERAQAPATGQGYRI